MRGTTRWAVLAVFAALALALGATACGGGGDTSGSTGKAGAEADSSAGANNAEVAKAAKEAVAPFIGKPSPFPVTEKLKEIPKGATIAYMESGSPFSALLYELALQAAETMGVKLERIKAGGSASQTSAAFDAAVANEPDAVIVNGIATELWSKQLKEFQEKGIAVVPSGVLDVEKYGIEGALSSNADDERAGKLMANYVVGEMNPEANVVVYDIPEITLTKLIAESFTEEIGAICPKCSVRTTHIPLASVGTTAPNTVVSDLQANPETTNVVFSAPEIATGVPEAFAKAGINVETLSYAPTPTNLQYMKEGKETAGLGSDVAVLGWSQVDQAAREIVGQKLTGLEAEGLGVIQFLTKKDITFDPSQGWTGYPDFAERFAKLWGMKG
ncbi:MAG: substrate-binding domain-containing protein [Actinobacteria bacterium]|nr:substrate-binding domain-containing protein [Actinomycetota bacterium]